MGTTIGEVNINLRMSLAQFQQDVKAGSSAAGAATKRIADDTGTNIGQARETLRLLSEDVGVTIPRGLQSLIAGIPAVGTALNAAFSGIALIAIIDLIGKVISKIQEVAAQAGKAAEAWDALGVTGKAALTDLGTQFLQLQVQLDRLAGDNLKALQDQMKVIDAQTLKNLTAQFVQLQAQADKAFDAMQKGWVASLLTFGDNSTVKGVAGLMGEFWDAIAPTNKTNAALANAKEGFDELVGSVLRFVEAGDNAAAVQKITEGISKLQAALNKPIQNDSLKDAYQNELTALQQLSLVLSGNQKNADASKQIAQSEEIIQGYQQQQSTIKSLQDMTDSLANKDKSAEDKRVEDIQKAIAQVEAYGQAMEGSGGSISVIANKLEEKLLPLLKEAKIAADGTAAALQLAASMIANAKAPDLGPVSMPTYTGDPRALNNLRDLAKLQDNVNDAEREGKQVYKDTETNAEKYADALDHLGNLLSVHAIDQDTFNRRVAELKVELGQGGAIDGVKQFFQEFQNGGSVAKDTFDLMKAGVDGFEQNLAEMLATGKANWTDYFNTLDEMLIKMSLNTLFKDTLGLLGNLGGGFGSFFNSIGIGAGHAAGGPVDAGVLYPVGEQGPEWFKPSVPGTIIPNGGLKGGGGSKGSGGQTIVQNISINGVQDADSFKKSMPQVRAEMYRSAAQAHGRLNR